MNARIAVGIGIGGWLAGNAALAEGLENYPRLAPSGRVEETSFGAFAAYAIGDGRTRAVVVPELAGRVMEYGPVGGTNLLWTVALNEKPGKFHNWGGDKTFIGPHAFWLAHSASRWPPRPTWCGVPHEARVAGGRILITESPVWEGFQVRIRREYWYTTDGELAIRQTFHKTGGDPEEMAIWSISQVNAPDVVRLPGSAGKMYRVGASNVIAVADDGRGTLTVTFGIDQGQGDAKVSFDASETRVEAVWGGLLWRQRGEAVGADFRNGATNDYYTVEVYRQGPRATDYVELELLSPVFRLCAGETKSYTIYWQLSENSAP